MRTFSREDLLELAGRRSYERGVDYVSEVGDLTVDGDTVRGTVTGTLPYRVELTPRANGMSWYCDCPWAEEGNFCKHAVALGLVHLFNVEHGVETPAVANTRAYLESLGHGELVDLVLEIAAASPEVRDRLELRAVAGAGGEADLAALRSLIDRALRVNGFVEYGQARGYAQAVEQVADELARLLDEGRYAEAEELSRYAIGLLDEHAGLVDDSSGYVGGAAHRFVDIHVEACGESGGDPVRLADWLLAHRLDGSGMVETPLGSYADALGREGMDRYREELFRVRSERSPEDWSAHFLMTEFARVTGDTDLLVELYASHGNRVHYTGIVDALHAAGRRDEALRWAHEGLEKGGGWVDERLVDYAVRAYRESGREEEVRELRWTVFERSPEERTYRILREDTPEQEWPQVREQALAVLRRSAARRQRSSYPSTLVEVLLNEGNAQEAWEAAVEHGCDGRQWLRVAALRETSHPQDALEVYLPQVAEKVRLTDTALYPEAADLARKVHRLYERLGRAEEARAFVDGLRSEHRRKRRFMAELDRVGLAR